MLGAIIGDVVGSIYEAHNIRTKDFPLFGPGVRFTDDTVCTVAIADCVLHRGEYRGDLRGDCRGDFARYLRAYVRRYPDAGYGGMFRHWALATGKAAYGSWGNGAAMRVCPIAYAAAELGDVMDLAALSAAVTHDHPDAITGAEAVAVAVRMALDGADRERIRATVADWFGYDLTETVDGLRGWYGVDGRFDVSCAGTVPPALICALDATDFEDALRNAVSIGGDTDTVACITGGLAEALYGIPPAIAARGRTCLDSHLRGVVDAFATAFSGRKRSCR